MKYLKKSINKYIGENLLLTSKVMKIQNKILIYIVFQKTSFPSCNLIFIMKQVQKHRLFERALKKVLFSFCTPKNISKNLRKPFSGPYQSTFTNKK